MLVISACANILFVHWGYVDFVIISVLFYWVFIAFPLIYGYLVQVCILHMIYLNLFSYDCHTNCLLPNRSYCFWYTHISSSQQQISHLCNVWLTLFWQNYWKLVLNRHVVLKNLDVLLAPWLYLVTIVWIGWCDCGCSQFVHCALLSSGKTSTPIYFVELEQNKQIASGIWIALENWNSISNYVAFYYLPLHKVGKDSIF